MVRILFYFKDKIGLNSTINTQVILNTLLFYNKLFYDFDSNQCSGNNSIDSVQFSNISLRMSVLPIFIQNQLHRALAKEQYRSF